MQIDQDQVPAQVSIVGYLARMARAIIHPYGPMQVYDYLDTRLGTKALFEQKIHLLAKKEVYPHTVPVNSLSKIIISQAENGEPVILQNTQDRIHKDPEVFKEFQQTASAMTLEKLDRFYHRSLPDVFTDSYREMRSLQKEARRETYPKLMLRETYTKFLFG